jgi:hypothetical protein
MTRTRRPSLAVLPAVTEKAPFGEFAARVIPGTGGHMAVDRAWVQRHILTAAVPILGDVTCNRAILPQLKGALGQIASAGLAGTLQPAMAMQLLDAAADVVVHGHPPSPGARGEERDGLQGHERMDA